MSIQEGINKALGIGAVLATQSPLMEKQKIKAAKKSEVKRLNTQAGLLKDKLNTQAKLLKDKATAEVDPKDVDAKAPSKEAKHQLREANRQLREVNRRLFELNPTTETSKDYYDTFDFFKLKKMEYAIQMNALKRMQDANTKAEIERYNRQVQNQEFKVLKESKKNGKT